jgi:hypothetical protein
MSGLYEITEDSMVAAHKAGIAYWQRNTPIGATADNIESLARSLGYHEGDMYAFIAGFFGARRRAETETI